MNLQDCRNMAADLFARFQLDGWEFAFDRSKSRFGLCDCSIKFITMSRQLVELNNEHEVRLTMLHEIAHALTPGDGHGKLWAQKCVELGIIPARCYNAPHRNVVTVKPTYYLKCPNVGCQFKEPRHRKLKKGIRAGCPFCCAKYNGGRFDPKYELTIYQAA